MMIGDKDFDRTVVMHELPSDEMVESIVQMGKEGGLRLRVIANKHIEPGVAYVISDEAARQQMARLIDFPVLPPQDQAELEEKLRGHLGKIVFTDLTGA